MATPQNPLTNVPGKAGRFPVGVAGLFAVVGLALLGGGIYNGLETRHDIAVGVTAGGTVTDLVAGSDSDGDTVYYPHVRFVTESGDAIEFTSSIGASPPDFDVGETVSVLYDPALPGKARIDSFFQLWFSTLILGGMGAVFAAIGGAGLILRARSKVRPEAGSTQLMSAHLLAERQGTGVVQRRQRD